MTNPLKILGAVLVSAGLGLYLGSGPAAATPLTFNFVATNNSETTSGSISFDTALLPNPTTGQTITLPSPEVLNLSATTSGVNLTFSTVFWSTGGTNVDFTQPVLQQLLQNGGGFSLVTQGAAVPTDPVPFTLVSTDGDPPLSVPEPTTLALMGAGLAGMEFARRSKKKKRAA